MEVENNIFNMEIEDSVTHKPDKITKSQKKELKKQEEKPICYTLLRKQKRARRQQRLLEALSTLTPTQKEEYFQKQKLQALFFIVIALLEIF